MRNALRAISPKASQPMTPLVALAALQIRAAADKAALGHPITARKIGNETGFTTYFITNSICVAAYRYSEALDDGDVVIITPHLVLN